METLVRRLQKPKKLYSLGKAIDLRVPVVQACLGPCDGPKLAAAVSRAGALGTLTIRSPEEVSHRRRLERLRRLTNLPVLLAFTAEYERETVLLDSLAAGHRHFQVFWWNGPRLARRIRAAGGTVFWQVGDLDQARDAINGGADILVAQGTAAGGPVRSPHPIRDLVEIIHDLSGATPLPIVAGGGFGDREDVAQALSWGASAALMGTRFLLTDESNAPLRDKKRLLRQSVADLVLDKRLIGDWPCAPRRHLSLPSDEDRSSLYAGRGLDRIKRILPAGEAVRLLLPK